MTEIELRKLAENEGFKLTKHIPTPGFDDSQEYWVEYPVIVGPDDYDWENEPAVDLDDAEKIIKNIIWRRATLESLHYELNYGGGIDNA